LLGAHCGPSYHVSDHISTSKTNNNTRLAGPAAGINEALAFSSTAALLLLPFNSLSTLVCLSLL
jgi:hypothetical protein